VKDESPIAAEENKEETKVESTPEQSSSTELG
jgi:hypothetical protein